MSLWPFPFKRAGSAPGRVDADTLDALAEVLSVLASAPRLSLLASLQSPRTVADLAVAPSREDEGLAKDRAISRQSVERHLEILADAGLVTWREGEGKGRPAKEYLLNHARLFAAIEELRVLTRLRATVAAKEDTMDLASAPLPDPESIAGPRLVVVRGVPEGLVAPVPEGREVVLGRGEGAHVRLDHDPFVSQRHCALKREGTRVAVADAGTSRNGTALNGRRLGKGESASLRRGNLLAVGRSLLLYLD